MIAEQHGDRHEKGGADETPGIFALVPVETGRDPDTPKLGDVIVGSVAPPGVGFLTSPTFILVGAVPSSLINSRRLTAGTGIVLTDAGGLSTITISATAAGAGTLYIPFGSEANEGQSFRP